MIKYIILIIFFYCLIYIYYNYVLIRVQSFDNLKFTIYNDTPENIKYKIELLNTVIKNMYILKSHLVNNINNFPEYKIYINQLNENFNSVRTQIYETNPLSSYTSYSINKGSELSICLKSKSNNTYHDINLLMYVAIHEMAHFANPNLGHDELFSTIFKKFIEEAVKLNLYKIVDYKKTPIEYCGLTLNTSIV